MKRVCLILTSVMLVIVCTDKKPTASEAPAIVGTLTLQPGVSGNLDSTRVAIYVSHNDWLNHNVHMSTLATGSGSSAAYTMPIVAPGNYFLDAWKDVNNNGLSDSGDLFGWYGTGVYPDPILTQVNVTPGQFFTANVTLIILP